MCYVGLSALVLHLAMQFSQAEMFLHLSHIVAWEHLNVLMCCYGEEQTRTSRICWTCTHSTMRPVMGELTMTLLF